jgi:enamine deaminase RidA (YjgF/YER057c/UK114 family)
MSRGLLRRVYWRSLIVEFFAARAITRVDLHAAQTNERHRTMSAEKKLAELKIELPPPPKPAGVYKPVVIAGNMCYASGHGPLLPDGTMMSGRVGLEVDQQAGYDAARQTGLAILATLRASLGSLDRVKRVVKLLGMVNCTPDFTQQPAVINGCSELFAQVFGSDEGVGARSAVGMGSLPGNISVEIEAIFELRE